MPELLPKERLQPALLDRLTDSVGGIERQLLKDRQELLPKLSREQRAALGALVDPERHSLRAPTQAEMAPFATLDTETRSLLERVIALEQRRLLEFRQGHVISGERLKASVLRDLTWLFNTERLDGRPLEVEGLEATPWLGLEDYPEVATSVVNYGIPSLAGKVGTGMDLETLEREVKDAICCFEPRLRRHTVRVTAAHDPEAMGHNTLSFEIEAELWAEPLPFKLWLRTLIDLDDATATVQERAA